ncbi:hypothetical protein EVAR_103868_1 [Eumeta japonica]|uniref:Uncharacterized protein n=1 Tax=Eumeta variegata TaxID=151549 RepID=A0A4C2AED9_EUMVA|nr:hypothetical protein EVAR_103868_1 [Eumeta japonica]
MADRDKDEAAVFTPRQSICRTPQAGETERSEAPADPDVERSLRDSSKEELLSRAHGAIKAIFGVVTGPGSKLNKNDTNSVASHGQDILAVVAALNLRLAEAELAAASAKLEAARAVAACGEPSVAQPAGKSYATALKLSGPARASAEMKRPASGPVLAFYPAAEQADNIKTAEETKKVLKSAMDPTALQVQVSKVRKVGRAGVVVQTTSVEAADKIKKAVPPTLRVTEPRSRRPLVALRNLSGDPSGEAVMTGLFEQNLRIKHPEWPLERLVRTAASPLKSRDVNCVTTSTSRAVENANSTVTPRRTADPARRCALGADPRATVRQTVRRKLRNVLRAIASADVRPTHTLRRRENVQRVSLPRSG